MDNDEYLKLIEKYLIEQYETEDEDIDMNHEDITWIPSEPEKKVIDYNLAGCTDLTTLKGTVFIKKMEKLSNFKIGPFIIKILFVSKDGKSVDICIYEEGKTSKILNKVQVSKDSRFKGKEWCNYFDSHNYTYSGKLIPIIILPEIARWLQAIHKLSAFL